MNAEQFADLAKKIKVGKKLPDAIYFHKEAFKVSPPILVKVINNIAKALKIDDDEWNLVKVFKNDFRISLLNYPHFFEDSYPCLTKSVNIDLAKLKHRVTDYSDADCSGQLILATDLYSSQYLFSDSLGVSPPL